MSAGTAARSNFSASNNARFSASNNARSQQFAANRWSGRNGHHRHHGGRGFGAGFATGALIGSAGYGYGYGYPYYDDGAYAYSDGYYDDSYAAAPDYGSDADAQSCAQRYRSYDPASGTYLGYDGIRHPCP
jgi:hypothetical protein